MSNYTTNDSVAAFWGNPSVNGLHALSAVDFQRCVESVFARAGYQVESRPLNLISNVKLDLFSTDGARTQTGAVVVQHVSANQQVSAKWLRKLRYTAAVRKKGVSAYVISNGHLDAAANNEPGQEPRTYLLGGEQFCRYVRYVRASRFPEGIGLSVQIPPDLFAGVPWVRRKPRGAKVLVVANNKGGVGKTTSARQIALHMAHNNLQVLLIDLDPQHNLTEGLFERSPVELDRALSARPNLVQYFSGQSGLPPLVRSTSVEGEAVKNLFLIPAHPDLTLLDTGGAGRPTLEMHFAQDVAELVRVPNPATGRPFDWVIIDTPPAVSLFTRAALCAADYVLTPARSRPSSLAGIQNVLKTIDTLGQLRGTPPRLLGCLLTHWGDDQHSTETYPRLDEIFANAHSRILATPIPFDVTIEKTHGPTAHRASNAYAQVTKEVLEYVQSE